MLVRLLYASRSAKPLCSEQMDAILAESRAHNPDNGVTGILCYSGDTFMQVLEGGRREVSTLYNAITHDPRHHDLMLLHFEEIRERRFFGWTMGQVNLAKVNPSTLLKYSEKPELDPYTLSGSVSLALLEELIATAAIIGR
ncbi:BLUF domain-containing protein [Chitinimonas sp. BJB300]|uniref:BLUF domain-containing protein n=1 Tax=Chitinimonas sp. BJB300 TaxID=1559339 RepID=UPI000C12091B|nr:BLUF domain-containing protein [Chitinimonas sp. BJB300]PHV09869.1 blue light sensor protein [Chitinimonas sp. BJB300]TSJ87570.1 BLUF domain-containing protein [Chitinimonas sp. BJB300]